MFTSQQHNTTLVRLNHCTILQLFRKNNENNWKDTMYMQCNRGKRYNWPILPYKDEISLVHLRTVYVEALEAGVFVLSVCYSTK